MFRYIPAKGQSISKPKATNYSRNQENIMIHDSWAAPTNIANQQKRYRLFWKSQNPTCKHPLLLLMLPFWRPLKSTLWYSRFSPPAPLPLQALRPNNNSLQRLVVQGSVGVRRWFVFMPPCFCVWCPCPRCLCFCCDFWRVLFLCESLRKAPVYLFVDREVSGSHACSCLNGVASPSWSVRKKSKVDRV